MAATKRIQFLTRIIILSEITYRIKGRPEDISLCGYEATQPGADSLFTHTGKSSDVITVVETLVREGSRRKVAIAIAGGIRPERIENLRPLDMDVLEIGREIADALLSDTRLEIVDGNMVTRLMNIESERILN